jgi:thioredoxin reductase (NADPH)
VSNEIENVIIIGSGPAGLTSAIYSARANLKPLMIEGEEVGGQLMTTNDVENYPGFEKGITGPELMQVTKAQAERFGTRFVTANVTKVDFSQRPFKVWVGETLYQSKTIIVSTGASARYLGLESEHAFKGKGVSACATCDGAFYNDLNVCVIGGGDTALEEAQFLTRFAKKVWVIHRRDEFRASKIMSDRVKNHPDIEIVWNSSLKEVKGDRFVTSINVYNNKTEEVTEMPMDGVFIAIGHVPNTKIFEGQLELQDTGYIQTKPDSTYTSVDGVFASGDVQDHIYRQAITAAGTGCMAAIDAERWLESNEA